MSYSNIARFLIILFFFSIPFAFIKVFVSQLNLPFFILILIILFDFLVVRRYKNNYQVIHLMSLSIVVIIINSFINYVPGFDGGWSFLRQLFFYFVGFYSVTTLMSYSSVTRKEIEMVFIYSVLLLALISFIGFGNRITDGRLFVFGMNPNAVALFAVISFFFVLSRMFLEGIRENILYVSAKLSSSFYLLLATGSRGGIISIAIIILLIFFLKEKSFKKRLNYFVVSLCFVCLLFFIVTNNQLLNKRFFESEDVRDAGRLELWQKVFSIVDEDLFFGVGVFEYQKQIKDLNNDRIINTHNEFLSFLVYSGILGLFLFLLFLIKLFKISIRNYKINNNPTFLVLLALIIINLAKSGGLLLSPIFWGLLCYIIVFGSEVKLETKQIT